MWGVHDRSLPRALPGAQPPEKQRSDTPARWESLWATEQPGALHLGDAEAIFDTMIYSLTNPVKDHLVDKALNWPGFSSLRYQLSGKPVVVERPKWFFDPNGKLPEEVELRFERPPEFAHLSQQEWTDKIRAAVAEEEQKAAAERQQKRLTPGPGCREPTRRSVSHRGT